MSQTLNRFTVVAAAGLAFSVLGLTASLSQYLSIARQQKSITAIVLIQTSTIQSVERLIDPALQPAVIRQLRDYKTQNEQFTEGLTRLTASMAYREGFAILMWVLIGGLSTANLLLLSSKKRVN
jgi:hypothetical protein